MLPQTLLIDPNTRTLQIVDAYLRVLESSDSTDSDIGRLVLVLQIFRRALLQRTKPKTAARMDWLLALKHGVREAESLLEELQESSHRLTEILVQTISELTKDIAGIESLYPEMGFAFDLERARYRRRKNEAESL